MFSSKRIQIQNFSNYPGHGVQLGRSIMSSSSNKPELPVKPQHIPPPPVPLRTNRIQQSQVSAQVSANKDYPMNATWLFHAPPPTQEANVDRKQWIRERTNTAGDLPPKLCHKTVPVLPVKTQSHSADSSLNVKPSPGPRTTEVARDINFSKEIKSRCIQRLIEKLPPQVHCSTNVSII